MGDILKELMSVEQSCADAFNQAKVQDILAYFSDEISGFSSTSHQRFNGKSDLEKTFDYYLSEAEKVTFELSEPRAIDLGDMAILDFYWVVTLITGEKKSEINGRGSHVYQRTNGEWKIIYEHFSRAH